jgi:aminomethyltransferase
VTSGTFSPILKKAIAMGYVDTAYSKAETPVHVQVRGKMVPSKVVKLPFVPSKYKK